jgi:hypothetical protein
MEHGGFARIYQRLVNRTEEGSWQEGQSDHATLIPRWITQDRTTQPDAYHNTCRRNCPQTAVAYRDDAAQLTSSTRGLADAGVHSFFVSGREVCITLVNRTIRPG